jgi:hypothetical protein
MRPLPTANGAAVNATLVEGRAIESPGRAVTLQACDAVQRTIDAARATTGALALD